MNVVRWTVWVLIAVAVAVAWRRGRYPGGWAPAFGRDYAAERRELAQARRRLLWRAVKSRAELTGVRVRLATAEGARQNRIDAAQRRLDEALHPQTGQVVGELGSLVLREHALCISDDVQLPLTGVTVQVHPDIDSHHLAVIDGDGQVHHVPLPRDQYGEDTVHAFAASVANTVLRDDAFRAARGRRVSRARQQLAEAEADTEQVEAVRAELDELIRQQRLDPDRAAALTRLKVACQRWETRTGRLPTR